jgi:hypothetical protein
MPSCADRAVVADPKDRLEDYIDDPEKDHRQQQNLGIRELFEAHGVLPVL